MKPFIEFEIYFDKDRLGELPGNYRELRVRVERDEDGFRAEVIEDQYVTYSRHSLLGDEIELTTSEEAHAEKELSKIEEALRKDRISIFPQPPAAAA